jgi:hypothetical protein
MGFRQRHPYQQEIRVSGSLHLRLNGGGPLHFPHLAKNARYGAPVLVEGRDSKFSHTLFRAGLTFWQAALRA